MKLAISCPFCLLALPSLDPETSGNVQGNTEWPAVASELIVDNFWSHAKENTDLTTVPTYAFARISLPSSHSSAAVSSNRPATLTIEISPGT